MKNGYALGLDFGTDSVRALLVRLEDGKEAATSVCHYPRWKKGLYCSAEENRFRQHPLDHLECMQKVITDCLGQLPDAADNIVGICADTTGSTPVAVDKDGVALALRPEFCENPNAMFILWKDHTATDEATSINSLAKSWGGTDYTKYCGGTYSSEWFWAKILHTLRVDENVRNAAFSWVEHSDWIPAILTGNTDPLKLKRGRCAAGHKAMWHSNWDGLPCEEFLFKLDPLLTGIRERLFTETFTAEVSAGGLCSEWAEKLGLPEGIPVALGAFDAHLGAVGACVRPGVLTKVVGTSTCDMTVASYEAIGNKNVRGICGQVDGSITPGLIGLEAGQSAFGDLYSWFRDLTMWPANKIIAADTKITESEKHRILNLIEENTLRELDSAAAEQEPQEGDAVALDWINGRRTPDADQNLKMAIAGLSMGTTTAKVYRALVESTAFGARRIVERFIEKGVDVSEIIAIGGIAKKSSFVMQVCADVIGRPISVAGSSQCCALGAAIMAAVACGAWNNVDSAQKALGSKTEKVYEPNPARVAIYEKLYQRYLELGKFAEDFASI